MNPSVAMSLLLLSVTAVVCSTPAVVQAQYHPDHPKVQGMVDRAMGYLDKNASADMYAAGGAALAGYTALKVTGDPEHPKVKTGIQAALTIIRKAVSGSTETHIVYDTGVACLLLSAVSPEVYRSQLEAARDWFVRVQKNHGGHGYLDASRSTGDTSQVQYAMLATWSMHNVGIRTPVTSTEASIRYLLATQDPSGSWGYQGVVSNSNSLVGQMGVSRSLGTAGICALLLACDELKLFGNRSKDEDGIPKAFERIDNIVRSKNDPKPTIKREQVDEALNRAFNYQDRAGPQAQEWYYYWRYGQERYESLREIVKGKQEKSPAWYNQGVEEFARTQSPDGSWKNGTASTAHIDTCFAVLFLIRSTQKAIGKLDEGVAFGGYELPKDVSSIRMVGDKIVSNKDTSVESLLSLMEDEKNYVGEGMLANNMALSRDPAERTQQVARLSRLLDSQNAVARRLSARLLGRSEDLSVVPDLIYALSDKDPFVPKLAEESLRLLSRRLDTVHIREANPKDQQRSAAISYWKAWYLGIKPDFVFLDR